METAGCHGIFQGPDDEDGDHKTLAWLVVQRERYHGTYSQNQLVVSLLELDPGGLLL